MQLLRIRRTVGVTVSTAAVAGILAIVAASPASAKQGVPILFQGGPHNTFNGVWCVQIAVNVQADGDFGPRTTKGVENFQSKRPSLGVDGMVGPATGKFIVQIDKEKGHANCFNWVPTP